jgi:carbonic anhydrase
MADVEISYRYRNGLSDNPRLFPADAQVARARLEAGNEAFAELLSSLETSTLDVRRIEIPLDARDVGIAVPGLDQTPSQRPFAAILGCSDARVPTELLFGEGPNDLFVVRVAGNVLGHDVLGSLRYAAHHLPLRCIVVLGHSGCGAVTAAVDMFLNPSEVLGIATDHEQRGLLSHMLLSVHAASRTLTQVHGEAARAQPGWRGALIELSVAVSAAAAAYAVERGVTALGDGHSIRCLHGVYVIDSRRVCSEHADVGERRGLAPTPPSKDAFKMDFAALAMAPRNKSLLATRVPA